MPIVKFVDGVSGVAVDICLEETSGLESSNLARKATRTFPAYRPLVLLLKRLLSARCERASRDLERSMHAYYGSAGTCRCEHACMLR